MHTSWPTGLPPPPCSAPRTLALVARCFGTLQDVPGALHNLDTALYGGSDLADCNKWSALKCARAKAPQALFQDDEVYPDEPDSAVRAADSKPAPFVKKGPKVSAKSFFETKSSKASKSSKKKTTPMKQ